MIEHNQAAAAADAAALAEALAPPADARAQALALIKALAPEGHALSYMAGALKRALIPTVSGRGGWNHNSVKRLADEAGIKVGYRRAG
jgi:hypothetical protein